MALKIKVDLTKPVEQTTETLNSAIRFIGSLIAPVAAESSLLLNDVIKDARARNLHRIYVKWREKRIARGEAEIFSRTLPPEIGFLLIEAASLEPDDAVQDLWASLIDEATKGEGDFRIEKHFIETLRSLSGPDIRLLLFFRAKENREEPSLEELYAAIDEDTRNASIHSLLKAGLIRKLDRLQLGPWADITFPAIVIDDQFDRLSQDFMKFARDLSQNLESVDPFRMARPEAHFELSPYGVLLLKRCVGVNER